MELGREGLFRVYFLLFCHSRAVQQPFLRKFPNSGGLDNPKIVSSFRLLENGTENALEVSYCFSHAEDCESGWKMARGIEGIP